MFHVTEAFHQYFLLFWIPLTLDPADSIEVHEQTVSCISNAASPTAVCFARHGETEGVLDPQLPLISARLPIGSVVGDIGVSLRYVRKWIVRGSFPEQILPMLSTRRWSSAYALPGRTMA